ncbi:MAG: DUF1501 domain-containing protein [Granulosicoccus sp.]
MQRRDVLQLIGAGMLLPTGLLPMQMACAKAASHSGRRLILVELAGANDGLNTLVPYTNDHYHALRPVIGLGRDDIVQLDDELAMHRELEPLMSLWDKAELAWVHGLGYPRPNRSHFKSMALWETGGDGNQEGRRGWITHDLEHQYLLKSNDPHGISMDGGMNVFASDTGRWMSMSSARQIANFSAPLPKDMTLQHTSLQLVTKRMQELHQSLGSLSRKLGKVPSVKMFPGAELGRQLRSVVQLIRAGVDTPVYRVRLDGFDTHQNQPDRHAKLLRKLAASLSRLRQVLREDGEWANTVVMTYSEFGRRAAENLNNGTDHGTAAPHIVMGGMVSGGFYGQQPDLGNLLDGDPQYTMDYRALYGTLLREWFDIDNNQFANFREPRLSGLMHNT